MPVEGFAVLPPGWIERSVADRATPYTGDGLLKQQLRQFHYCPVCQPLLIPPLQSPEPWVKDHRDASSDASRP